MVCIFCLSKTVSGQPYSSPVIIANSPWATSDLIIDPEGNLFFCGYQVSGAYDGRIYKLKKTPTGYDPNPVHIASGLGAAWDLVIDQNRNLFCIDPSTGKIFKISYTGGGNYNSVPVLVTTGLNGCMGLAIDNANGNLYSLHYNPGRVLEITNTGGAYSTTPTVIATGLVAFSDIIVDNAGNLYFTSEFYDAVYMLPKVNGAYSTVILK